MLRYKIIDSLIPLFALTSETIIEETKRGCLSHPLLSLCYFSSICHNMSKSARSRFKIIHIDVLTDVDRSNTCHFCIITHVLRVKRITEYRIVRTTREYPCLCGRTQIRQWLPHRTCSRQIRHLIFPIGFTHSTSATVSRILPPISTSDTVISLFRRRIRKSSLPALHGRRARSGLDS